MFQYQRDPKPDTQRNCIGLLCEFLAKKYITFYWTDAKYVLKSPHQKHICAREITFHIIHYGGVAQCIILSMQECRADVTANVHQTEGECIFSRGSQVWITRSAYACGARRYIGSE